MVLLQNRYTYCLPTYSSHTQSTGHNFILDLTLQKYMQKSSSAYGAHFCTSGLMLLRLLFVLSIIVLKEKTKPGSVSVLLLHNFK